MKKRLFIYQLLPRLFGNTSTNNIHGGTVEQNGCGKFNDISDNVLGEIENNGYTHIWFTGILAHASATDYSRYGMPPEFPEIIKGRAGSPYAIRDYYDVDPDLAVNVENRVGEFMELVRRSHRRGLGVIIDHVPNHVARNYHSVCRPSGLEDLGASDDKTVAFAPSNNFYYIPGQPLELDFVQGGTQKKGHFYREFPAKATGNDCFSNKPTHHDWYETVKLNYGVDYGDNMKCHFDPIPDTWYKMRNILLFWAEKQIDGFRCDMAEMVPIAYWRWVIPQIKALFPQIIFIAEIYNPARYREFLEGECFDYLYDKVGLYDMLRDVSCGKRPSSDITFTLNSVGDIRHRMLGFMENHDEQRIASDFFLGNGQSGKAAMMVTCAINIQPVMVYSGQEFGERGMDDEGFSGRDGRTSIFDYWSVCTLRRWNNNRQWNSELLTEDEVSLANFYRRLINLCAKEPALNQGPFYDLMPSNYENMDFDSTRLFAFLRGSGHDLLLVLANFDDNSQSCSVVIPSHAFDFMNVENWTEGELKPLLEHSYDELPVFDGRLVSGITIAPNSGEIFRFSFSS